MLDHVGLAVSDYAKACDFYLKALKPLGYELVREFSRAGGAPDVAGLGVGGKPDFWLVGGTAADPPVHLAFSALNAAQVRAFHAAALAAGGRDNGAPGIREHYHPYYFGAFVFDPDGNNIEAVCHRGEA